jgi:hypothetical protein
MTLQQLVDRELDSAAQAQASGDVAREWLHLERAHVAAQPLFWRHTRVHWRMLRCALRQRHRVEILAQTVLLTIAAPASITGLFQAGRNGRARGNEIAVFGVPDDILAAQPKKG